MSGHFSSYSWHLPWNRQYPFWSYKYWNSSFWKMSFQKKFKYYSCDYLSVLERILYLDSKFLLDGNNLRGFLCMLRNFGPQC